MQSFCLCGGWEEPLKEEQSNGAPRVKMGILIPEGPKGILLSVQCHLCLR